MKFYGYKGFLPCYDSKLFIHAPERFFMVFVPGFDQFSQGFHILQILDVEKNLVAVFFKIKYVKCGIKDV